MPLRWKRIRPVTRFKFPPPGRQVYVQAFLNNVRQGSLLAALERAAAKVDAVTLRAELSQYAPTAGLQALQGSGLRDEEVFATPTLLRTAPGTLGYYRLLLGVSQKGFYTTKTGLNIFFSMEDRQTVRVDADPYIEDLCSDLNAAMAVLMTQLPQGTLHDDVRQLPLLTLGAQADGSWRGQIGQTATRGVFDALKAVVKNQGKTYTETDVSITVTNSAGREVTLALAPDPDVVIREQVNNTDVYKVAIEIKGGTDYANLHNRVGEAEKSHQKARATGAQDCWTLIALTNANMARLRQESPTTREWFDMAEVLAQSGTHWSRLVTLTISAMGI
jgi:hypothetical protein